MAVVSRRPRYAPHAPRALRDEHFAFFGLQLRAGVRAPPPRRRRALAATDAALGAHLGAMYFRRHCAPATRAAAAAVGGAVQRALLAQLARAAWLSEPTRAAALRKVRCPRASLRTPLRRTAQCPPMLLRRPAQAGAMSLLVGAPAAPPPEPGLGGVVAGEPLLVVLLRARAAQLARRTAAADAPAAAAEAEWGAALAPHVVNACYDPQRNAVLLPAALLQPPLLDAGRGSSGGRGGGGGVTATAAAAAAAAAAAMNAQTLGSLGAVVAHEMTHGFDGTGRFYDEKGELRDWWCDADAAEFERRIVEQAARGRAQLVPTPLPP